VDREPLLRLHRAADTEPQRRTRRQDHPVITAAQLERIYCSYVAPIYRFIYSRLGNRQEAEDLTSQVFMKSLQYLDPTASPKEIEAYLYQIARTDIADHWRRYAALRVVPLDETPAALDMEEAGEATGPPATETLKADLERVLGLLPPNYRRVIELRFYDGCSIKETARAMEVTIANAKVLQYRAIQRAAALARGERTIP